LFSNLNKPLPVKTDGSIESIWRASPASYSFMRFATGAVLVPHGIQKIMLGSAVNLAPYIDKQMGVPIRRSAAIFASSTKMSLLVTAFFADGL
jgi:uncharacterized membrane protein YphA (DoxX/SURF4 family)